MIPMGSMYGLFTYIYHKHQLNVGKYTIHGSYGIDRLGSCMMGSTFLKLLPTAHLHLRRDLSL